jgi:hypothetical protein
MAKKQLTEEEKATRKANKGKGKAIVARFENVGGQSGVLLASSRKRALGTALYWNMDAKDGAKGLGSKPFLFTIDLPSENGEQEQKVIGMAAGQAMEVYKVHPRRVQPETLPPACPLSPNYKS